MGTMAATLALATLGACGHEAPAAAGAESGAPAAGASNSPAAAENPYTPLAKLPDWSGVWEPFRMARPRAAASA
jgi:hypothetical protein